MGARAISVQIQKLLLDLIFHIASRTVKPFIALARREAFRRIVLETFPWQVGNDEARVVLLVEHFGFADERRKRASGSTSRPKPEPTP